MLLDERLTAWDIRVYAYMAMTVFQGAIARVGMRLIAEDLKSTPRLVLESVHRLIEHGHLATETQKRGVRACYCLLSPVFAQKQGKITEVVSCPKGHRRMASVGPEKMSA